MKKRARTFWIIAGVLVIASLGTLYALVWHNPGAVDTFTVMRSTLTTRITALGRVEPVNQWQLSTQASGRVALLNVHPGDQAREGDLLLELDTKATLEAITQAEQTLALREQALDEALDAPSANDIEIARVRLLAATIARDRAQEDYDALEDSANTQEAEDLERARLEYEIADQELDRVLEGTPESRLNILRADVASASLALKQAQDRLAQIRIVAPADGTVMSVNASPGQNVYGYNTLIVLADTSALQVRAEIDELDVASIPANAPVSTRFDALPGESVDGVMASILPAPTSNLGATTFGALIPLNTALPLRPGMSATLEIQTGVATDVLVVPRQAIRQAGSAEYVTIMRGRDPQDVPIVTGLSDGIMVQVVLGLSEGDSVLVN